MDPSSLPAVKVLEGYQPGSIPEFVYQSDVPLLLKGLVSNWPAVQACQTVESASAYLSRFWSEKQVTAYIGDEIIEGRFFYNKDFTGLNFKSGTATLPQVMQKLGQARTADLASIYVGSTPVDQWLPGFRAQNDVPIPAHDLLMNFWLGTEARISAHYDFPNNLACVVAGERRFTLFPPEQVSNLYVGPLDRTPSGQAISLVDFAHPDYARFPKFKDALDHAVQCEMSPGDALFLPSMWWHHVEAFSDFNLLVNYWWLTEDMKQGSPVGSLMYALLTIRDLPKRQRKAWQAIFEHYVFNADESVAAHIPEHARGCLGELNETETRRLRAELLNRLNQ
ncbi:MAG: cupin-like domain-containing protein [Candidatus Azotimanducaceae bacterium WSBS_2022_MAG_OTU7]